MISINYQKLSKNKHTRKQSSKKGSRVLNWLSIQCRSMVGRRLMQHMLRGQNAKNKNYEDYASFFFLWHTFISYLHLICTVINTLLLTFPPKIFP